ncbi:hypothetical protein AVEN_111994-1 [Araneus ventricosus]|uniref:PiggyBac transposable element-derived protein domain-containing protein n=1 Tax=Araneus ventricosus TaxID=182803 RepID=A0A4Y2HZI6_ARAVE|nr:hypothetical protein AVEN_111994-1 [Araneus ventricosus]
MKFLTTEEASDYLMSLVDDESDDIDPEIIILPPDTDIATDDEEIDDAYTSIKHSHTAGTIEILKEKNDAEFIQHLNGQIVHRNFHQLLNHFTLNIIRK